MREDKGELDLHPGRNEPLIRNIAAGLEEHIVHERRVVRLRDLRGLLHGARREADFAALDGAAVCELEVNPCALNGVSVLDGHVWMRFGEEPHLLARLACLTEWLR